MAVHFYHLNAFDDWDTEYVQSMFNLHTQEKQSGECTIKHPNENSELRDLTYMLSHTILLSYFILSGVTNCLLPSRLHSYLPRLRQTSRHICQNTQTMNSGQAFYSYPAPKAVSSTINSTPFGFWKELSMWSSSFRRNQDHIEVSGYLMVLCPTVVMSNLDQKVFLVFGKT